MNTELNAITLVSCDDILIFKVRLKVIFQCNQTKSLELIDLKKSARQRRPERILFQISLQPNWTA